MLTRQGYFLIVLLFVVITAMFMLVNVSSSAQIVENGSTRPDNLLFDPLDTQGDSAASSPTTGNGDAGIPHASPSATNIVSTFPVAPNQFRAALLVTDTDSPETKLLEEWCRYSQCSYRVLTSLSDASALDGCNLILIHGWDEAWTDALLAATDTPRQMILTSMPDYAQVAASPALRKLLGISKAIAPSCTLEDVYFFDDFFIAGARIYESEEDAPYAVPHYALRSGYLVFANGTPEDESIAYTDYPPVLWRTRTNQADVFVTNTDMFTGKRVLGLITSFVSQLPPCYVYPIVNARTLSVENFPCLSEENTEQMRALYSTTSGALTRDQLFPSVEKIMRNYNQLPTFFLAPRLTYAGEISGVTELISYYYNQILKLGGALELAVKPQDDTPLEDVLAQLERFTRESIASYRFTACTVDSTRLDELLACTSPMLEEVTIITTDLTDDLPVLSLTDNQRMVVSFTDNGVAHDDLTLVTLVTALGLTNQQMDMADVYFPEDNTANWTKISREWSRNVTHLNNYMFLDTASLYTLESKARTFLSMDYTAQWDGTCLTVTSSASQNTECCFLLRLHNLNVVRITGDAECQQLADGQYLLCAHAPEIVLETESIYQVPIPRWKEDDFQ